MSIESIIPEELVFQITPVTLDIEQYRSLRAEILRGMEDGNQVISYGLAAISIVITAGLTEKRTILGFAITAVLVPLLSSLVLSLWLGTLERIARASFFITGIENRLKTHIGKPSLPTWDSWLRSSEQDIPQKSHHFWSTEYSGVSLFVCLMVAPTILSFFTAEDQMRRLVRYAVITFMIVAESAFFYSIVRRLMRWRKWLTSVFNASR